MESEDGLDDQDVVFLSLGLMLIIVGTLYLFGIIPAAAQGWYGGPPMYDQGPSRDPYRYEEPPCHPLHNPDCGRFSWEGPRSRAFRYERHPMAPDAPRGYPGAPYEGPDRW